MDTNLTEMLFPNNSMVQVFDYLTWLVFLVSAILFMLIFWAILNKTPKVMKTYKWYMLVNFTLVFFFDLIVGLSHPLLVGPYPAIVLGR
jgi:hypothetical protein